MTRSDPPVENVIKIMLGLVFFPMHLASRLVPKRPNLWLFGGWQGRLYTDNSRALFEYVSRNKIGVRAVWLTRDAAVCRMIRSQGLEAHLFYSFAGIWLSAVAGVLIECSSRLDLPLTAYLFSRRGLKVQLWHGTSLKKYNLKSGPWHVRALRFVFLVYLGREYDLVFTNSAKNVELFKRKERFNIEPDRIKVLGHPRNDELLRAPKTSFMSDRGRGERLVLYMPTWRVYPHDLFAAHGFDQSVMERFLRERGARLFIKLHPRTRQRAGSPRRSEFIDLIPDQVDAARLLPYFDILLTDYSNAYFDFLLLDRPIIFTAFDLQEYDRKQGFNYDYGSVTAGPKAGDWPQVLALLDELMSGSDRYAADRARLKAEFNDHQDDRNCARIADHLCRVVGCPGLTAAHPLSAEGRYE